MKNIFFLPLILVANSLLAQGGNNNALAFPSANNSFLGKAGSGANVGVDLYTGMAQVSIPICNLSSKELTIPVSVDYVDGRGVKVQEYASQVGLGWQLNAGGSISRVVRGFPDEQPNGYLGTGTSPTGVLSPGQQWGAVASGYCTGGSIPGSQMQALVGFYLGASSTPTADGEPDFFYVKTPFFAFQFVFDATGNPVYCNATGYKIITTNLFNTPSPACQNPSFEVIDDRGNQFYFGSTTASTEQSTDSLYNTPATFISTWYLDRIVTYNSKDIITLTYQAAPTSDVTYNYNWSETRDIFFSYQVFLSTGKNTVAATKYVATISSSLGEVDFNYGVRTRLDDNNAEQLNAVVLKAYNPLTGSNSTTLQTFTFNYSYFGLPSTNPDVLRLKLKGITVTGNTAATSTPLTVATFDYNSTVLPDRTWPVADYWGFCNSTTNPAGSHLDAIGRTANAGTLQAEILNAVYTTQGGVWLISYEPNTDGVRLLDGVRVNEISQILSTGSTNRFYYYVDVSNNPSGHYLSASYTQLSFVFNSTSLLLSSSPFVTGDMNGNFIGYSSVKEVEPNGGYTFYTFSNFNDANDINGIGFNDAMVVTWVGGSSSFPLIVSSIDLALKRGLLKDETAKDASGNLISETAYTYAPLNTTPLTFSGYGLRGFTFNAPAGGGSCLRTYYTPIENYRLSRTVHTDYDQLHLLTAVSVTTDYSYDPIDLRQIQYVSSDDSRGITHTVENYYANDISKTGPDMIPMLTAGETTAINSMVSSNNISTPVHTTDTRNTTISQVHNSYSTALNGNIYLTTISGYASDPVNATALIKQQTLVYDQTTSNLTSTNLTGGKLKTSLYSYNSVLPVGDIINASEAESFYQGFEQSGANVTTLGHTGTCSYSGSYSVPFTLPNGRSYLIQWWNYSGGVWLFNQQVYTGPTAITGQVDDIRIFPGDALFRTSTYNPLVGKTSETDPSGATTIYQYDGLNRLQTVFDQDLNVVKTYDYKYQVLPSTGSSSLVLTGVPGYSSFGPTTGFGTITGPSGYLVTVTMSTAGTPGFNYGLTVAIVGATSDGPTSVTNGTASFTFIMPVSGSVAWSASFVPTGGGGGGSFSIH